MTESNKTEAEKKPGRAETKQGENKQAAKKKKAKPVDPGSSNTATLTLILLVIIAVAAGFYVLWDKQQKYNKSQQQIMQSLEQEITDLKKQQYDAEASNKENTDSLKAQQENLRHNLTNLIRNKEHLRNDWLMAEAEYLIKIANHRLLLEKDVATAIVALKSADARLAEVADPALLAVRKILTADLQALGNIKVIDQAGLSVTLSALSNNIQNLPLNTPDPKTRKITREEKQQSAKEVQSIKDLPAAIWKDIKSLVVIRNHEKPLQPLLAPEQHFFLVQNLSLQFEQTRLALLNGNNDIFHERLKTMTEWIKQYFDTGHNVTRNMLSNIEELQKLDIDPALPDISSTYSVIKKYRTRGERPVEPEVRDKAGEKQKEKAKETTKEKPPEDQTPADKTRPGVKDKP